MKNLSLTLKIVTIFLVPVIALVYFSFYFVEAKISNLHESAKYQLSAKVTHVLSKLIHSIQIERGLSAGYIVTSDKDVKEKLALQYRVTNSAYIDLLEYVKLQSKEKDAIEKEIGHKNELLFKKIIYQWQSIESIRDRVLKNKISFDDEILYYSKLNSQLLHTVESFLLMLKKPTYDEMALSKLQYLKENAGLERAYLYNALLSKSTKNIEMIKELQRSQIANKKDFILNASMASALIYSQTLKTETIIDINRLRNQFLNNKLGDAKLWFNISSRRINMIEDISIKILQKYIDGVDKIYEDALNSLYITALFWLLSLISLSILIYTIRRLVTNEELNAEELRIAAYTFDSHEAMTITDVNGNILKVNNGFTRITGYTQEEVIGKNPRVLKSMKHGEEFYKEMWRQLHTEGKWSDEIYNMRKNGEIYLERLSITAIKDDHNITTHYIAQFLDISELQLAKEKAEHQADHDFLTGLANRKYLMSRLNEEFIKAKRHDFLHAFLFIDLDNFKKINDTYGHNTGDRLIQDVAAKLQLTVREEDFIARISGDEFAIMLLNIDTDEKEAARDVKEIANKILQTLSSPFIIDEHRIEISASIGIKLFPESEKSVNNVVIHADTAMYQAKNQGKNQFVFFDRTIELELKQLMLLEEEIQDGLKNSEFELYFQPKVNAKTALICGAELLSRWNHPTKGLLYPGSFIQTASDIGVLGEFTLLSLESACLFLQNNDALIKDSLAINISSKELISPAFTQILKDTIEKYGVNPSKIELEITEDELIDDFELAIDKITELKEYGVHFAIDDFGTGYSSITYLHHLPVDTLKIDKAFLDNLENIENQKLLNMMTNIAHTFKMKVVAEGIENEQQLKIIQANGTELYQGFYFSRAIKRERFIEILEKESL